MLAYGQNLEDVLLWRALGKIANGFYIDVGAQHPTIDSISKHFYDYGWRGINIEPSPQYAQLLRDERKDEVVIEAAVSADTEPVEFFVVESTGMSTGVPDLAARVEGQGFATLKHLVESTTLDNVFDTLSPPEIHWLKIDAEGMEDKVLAGWRTSSKRPWIVIIEALIASDLEKVKRDWSPELGARGYKEVYFDGINSFFLSEAHPELSDAFAVPPNALDSFLLAPTHTWCAPAMHHLHNEKTAHAKSVGEVSALQDMVRLLEARLERSEVEIANAIRESYDQKNLANLLLKKCEATQAYHHAAVDALNIKLDKFSGNLLARLRVLLSSRRRARSLLPTLEPLPDDCALATGNGSMLN